MVKLLIAHGEDVNQTDWDPTGEVTYTPVSEAISSRNQELVRFLISAGADKNELDSWLSWAAYQADVEMLKLLIDSGARVDPRHKGQMTALHNAAVKGNARAVKLLLSLGADPLAREDYGGYSVLDYAKSGRCQEVIDIIERAAAAADKKKSSPPAEK